MRTVDPNWAPLEKRLPLDDCGDWMWMSRVVRGSRVIEQYKHSTTRGYLNLDQDGNAWRIRFVASGCDPWCDKPHQHQPDPPPDVDPIAFDEALKVALS